MIIDKIKDTLKIAMKESKKDKVLAIRNILEKIKKIEVDSQKELDENEIIKIISKYAKQLRESIAQFKAGNRLDLVEKEKNELENVEENVENEVAMVKRSFILYVKNVMPLSPLDRKYIEMQMEN